MYYPGSNYILHYLCKYMVYFTLRTPLHYNVFFPHFSIYFFTFANLLIENLGRIRLKHNLVAIYALQILFGHLFCIYVNSGAVSIDEACHIFA